MILWFSEMEEIGVQGTKRSLVVHSLTAERETQGPPGLGEEPKSPWPLGLRKWQGEKAGFS